MGANQSTTKRSTAFTRLPQELDDEILSYIIPQNLTIKLNDKIENGQRSIDIVTLNGNAFNDYKSVCLVSKSFLRTAKNVLNRSIVAVTFDLRADTWPYCSNDLLMPPRRLFRNINEIHVTAPFSITLHPMFGSEHVVGHINMAFTRGAGGWVKSSFESSIVSPASSPPGQAPPGYPAGRLEHRLTVRAGNYLRPDLMQSASLWLAQRAFARVHQWHLRDSLGWLWTLDGAEGAWEAYRRALEEREEEERRRRGGQVKRLARKMAARVKKLVLRR